MAEIWEFDSTNQTRSGNDDTFYRINNARSEANTGNNNEGGLRIENESGIELWLSVIAETNDSNGYMAWVNDSGRLSPTSDGLFPDRRDGDEDEGNIYFAAANGTNRPEDEYNFPQSDTFLIAPSERDVNGDYTGRFVGTSDDPVKLEFKSGLGEWLVTFHKEDGSTVEVLIGDEDRLSDQYTSLEGWVGETAQAEGTFTHITIESQTASLNPDKNVVFQLDNISMGSYYCFLKGTLIETASGLLPVEELKAGDLVVTADGRTAPVRWIGVQRVPAALVMKECAYPIRIQADAISPGVPRRDLLVSPDHAIFIDGLLINASALVNGTSITQVDRMPMASFDYYHVETDAHELILAEGCPAETFIDYAGRKGFDNFQEYEAAVGPQCAITEMAYPRISARRQLPDHIKAKFGIADEPLLADLPLNESVAQTNIAELRPTG